MSEVLLYYRQVNPTTWAYLSSLLIIALYFKFNRFWSVRNLDLFLLILLAPGLLLIHFGQDLQTIAKEWKPTAQLETASSIHEKASDEKAGDEKTADPDSKKLETKNEDTEKDPAKQNPSPPPAPVTPQNPDIIPDVAPAAKPADANDKAASPEETPVVEPASTKQSLSSPANDKTKPSDDVAPNPKTPLVEKKEPGPSLDYGLPPKIHTAADRDRVYQLGETRLRYGFIWLHGVGILLLIRTLLDSTMSRRPLLEPNLTQGGLTFVSCALFIFLMANVIKNSPSAEDMAGPMRAAEMVSGHPLAEAGEIPPRQGPGSALIALLPSIPTIPILNEQAQAKSAQETAYANVARGMAIGSHLAIVLGMILIGYRHFDNVKMGVGAAALFLMLPYTSQMTGRVEHALPAALLIWAVVCYRQPTVAGILLGLAAGVVYYPLFLLPLWLSFYWPRGLMRFVSGLSYSLITCVLALFFFSRNMSEFWLSIQAMFGVWIPKQVGLEGIWNLGWHPLYRLPVITAFLVLSISMALWPAQKNLGTLLSCTAAVMIGTQFWHGYGGGLYMAWYLPLLLLTVFRPNLEDRVALSVLGEGWFPRRKRRELRAFDRAA